MMVIYGRCVCVCGGGGGSLSAKCNIGLRPDPRTMLGSGFARLGGGGGEADLSTCMVHDFSSVLTAEPMVYCP